MILNVSIYIVIVFIYIYTFAVYCVLCFLFFLSSVVEIILPDLFVNCIPRTLKKLFSTITDPQYFVTHRSSLFAGRSYEMVCIQNSLRACSMENHSVVSDVFYTRSAPEAHPPNLVSVRIKNEMLFPRSKLLSTMCARQTLCSIWSDFLPKLRGRQVELHGYRRPILHISVTAVSTCSGPNKVVIDIEIMTFMLNFTSKSGRIISKSS